MSERRTEKELVELADYVHSLYVDMTKSVDKVLLKMERRVPEKDQGEVTIQAMAMLVTALMGPSTKDFANLICEVGEFRKAYAKMRRQ